MNGMCEFLNTSIHVQIPCKVTADNMLILTVDGMHCDYADGDNVAGWVKVGSTKIYFSIRRNQNADGYLVTFARILTIGMIDGYSFDARHYVLKKDWTGKYELHFDLSESE